MVNPLKAGSKSEAEVAEEATRKKGILDQVAQSNLPTKTILKELGISRSTYYSWLKRYQEEGMEGLLDSRSAARTEEPEEEPIPAPEEETMPEEQVVESGAAPEEKPEESVEEAVAEQPEPEPEEPAAEPVKSEVREKEEAPFIEPKVEMGGEDRKRGWGVYAFVGLFLLIAGLLLTVSLSNYNTYEIKKSGKTLTLWRGKFAPRGSEIVQSFEPLEVGDSDVSSLTGRTFTGRDAAYTTIFQYFMGEIAAESNNGDQADFAKMDSLLSRAESLVGTVGNGPKGLAAPRFQLAQKRVAVAEMQLKRAYRNALPVYEEALKMKLGDSATLKTQIEVMQTALGLAAPETAKPAAEQLKTTPEPEKTEPVPEQTEPQTEAPGTGE